MGKQDLPKLGRLRVHSVLYGNEPNRVAQAISHLERAARLALATGVFDQVVLAYGDCSPQESLRETVLINKFDGSALADVEYHFFDANLGSAHGHNRLLEIGGSEFVLIMNPDIMMAPNAIVELARPFLDAKVGMAEAKQLPIEHPKQYDAASGDTGWAATACTLIPRRIVSMLEGFDHSTFFLYCDDVDFSWRVRLSGHRVVYCPAASAFHDKRLGERGAWAVGWAEKYYSAEAAMLLAYKFSREDLAEQIATHFETSGDEVWLKAVREYRRRQSAAELPAQLDSSHKVAVFTNGAYASHRFVM
ncbi:glycosyltransferase family 2 protein [Xanthomonas sp. WHRI 10064A]|uniref:glycosyltransferase family 2 protein n=1 Tax=Xanthomonas TaxID=338 RepID=UPI000E1EC0EB|nr:MULTISPECIES: glycosyltransferase family 2 protein [Xanthomonas]MEA9587221.1 glycosyltransferase family 2 protein [Xanthomonas sp. WHRI 10064B]MEA9616412.1 glycosyltransferase family 2 protein [Xanthomonas sp. WHRI 10064A]